MPIALEYTHIETDEGCFCVSCYVGRANSRYKLILQKERSKEAGEDFSDYAWSIAVKNSHGEHWKPRR